MVKDVKGYEGLYQISDTAEVTNIRTGRIKKSWDDTSGYKSINLYKDGKKAHKQLHRLMAEAFIPNPNNYPIVLHKDNDKQNPYLYNLIWGTYSDNNSQAIRDGLNTPPDRNNRKAFIITDGNGNSVTPFHFYGVKTVADIIEYSTNMVTNSFVMKHNQIQRGPYKGFYVERFEE